MNGTRTHFNDAERNAMRTAEARRDAASRFFMEGCDDAAEGLPMQSLTQWSAGVQNAYAKGYAFGLANAK